MASLLWLVYNRLLLPLADRFEQVCNVEISSKCCLHEAAGGNACLRQHQMMHEMGGQLK